jgi:drug/metabolite transporter (DMT)-like permease
MFPVTTTLGRLAVLGVAVLVLVAFLIWSRRTGSNSFFFGALAGTGIVLSFDIIWVHTLFGLHHLTNAPEDAILEPLFVFVGLAFLWYGVTRERRGKG